MQEYVVFIHRITVCLWVSRMKGMRLHALMVSLEKIAELMLDLTCKRPLSENTIHLNLISKSEDAKRPKFEMIRGKRRLVIKVLTEQNEGVVVDTCKAKRCDEQGLRLGPYQTIQSLGELRDCVCAHLVPNMRVLNVLKALLQDLLVLSFCDQKDEEGNGPCKCLMMGGGEKAKLVLWMDGEDRINLKGGCLPDHDMIKTFELDEVPMESDEKYHFFENPFLVAKVGSLPSLMPVTMEIVSLVLGSWSLDNLSLWLEPIPQARQEEPAVVPKGFAAGNAQDTLFMGEGG